MLWESPATKLPRNGKFKLDERVNYDVAMLANKEVTIQPSVKHLKSSLAGEQLGLMHLYRAEDSDNLKQFTDAQPSQGDVISQAFGLEQNYPNPFNPSTTIRYHLSQIAQVKITVYNALGGQVRVLVNESIATGRHEMVWDGNNDRNQPVGSGIYFLRMIATAGTRQFMDTKKIVLIK
jgi:hypothetical protein